MFSEKGGGHRVNLNSPLGILEGFILPSGEVAALAFDALPARWLQEPEVKTSAAAETAAALEEQLAAYFSGTLRRFDLPLAPRGTPFQQRIWQAISRVPYGSLTTYAGLAAEGRSPRAFRAAGTATGQNPLVIIIPCHRVLREELYHRALRHPETLTEAGNYAGGRDRKTALLRREGVIKQPPGFPGGVSPQIIEKRHQHRHQQG